MTAGHANRINVFLIYPHAQLPGTEPLRAKAAHWACDALNRTATTANPGDKSSHEIWQGKPPSVVLLPFLKPGYCKVRRESKSQART